MSDEIIIKEEIITKYSIKNLIDEKELLLHQLDISEPTDVELIEYGKMYHPYYAPKDNIQNRLNEINELLNK